MNYRCGYVDELLETFIHRHRFVFYMDAWNGETLVLIPTHIRDPHIHPQLINRSPQLHPQQLSYYPQPHPQP